MCMGEQVTASHKINTLLPYCWADYSVLTYFKAARIVNIVKKYTRAQLEDLLNPKAANALSTTINALQVSGTLGFLETWTRFLGNPLGVFKAT